MSDLLPTKPYRGTRDFLPEEMSVRTQVFGRLYEVIESFGYQRYDGPLLEPVEIYEAKSGRELVEKQLYTLTDKAGRRLALRPEMTPTVARMIAAHAGRLVFPVRWYSHPNCFRYEKPQRGRVREHWQINVDIFGSESVEAEVEIFDLVHALFEALGAPPETYEVRVNDRNLAVAALERFAGVASERAGEVLRVIDRIEKQPREATEAQLAEAGLSTDQVARVLDLVDLSPDAYLDAAGPEAVARSAVARIVREGLVDRPLSFDPRIVRGLDYYTSTVFEVFDTAPENRRSIFGGGRYDNLTELFSKRRIPGIGFGMGDVTLFDFLRTHRLEPEPDVAPHAVVIPRGPEMREAARDVARRLRRLRLRTLLPLDFAPVKKELRRAVQRGAPFAVLLFEEEWARGAVVLRDLRAGRQEEVPADTVAEAVRSRLCS